MAIEIVDLSIENGDFHSYVSLPEGMFSLRGQTPFARFQHSILHCFLKRTIHVHPFPKNNLDPG